MNWPPKNGCTIRWNSWHFEQNDSLTLGICLWNNKQILCHHCRRPTRTITTRKLSLKRFLWMCGKRPIPTIKAWPRRSRRKLPALRYVMSVPLCFVCCCLCVECSTCLLQPTTHPDNLHCVSIYVHGCIVPDFLGKELFIRYWCFSGWFANTTIASQSWYQWSVGGYHSS